MLETHKKGRRNGNLRETQFDHSCLNAGGVIGLPVCVLAMIYQRGMLETHKKGRRNTSNWIEFKGNIIRSFMSKWGVL